MQHPREHHRRPVLLILVAVLAAALLAAGCGSDSSSSKDDDEGSSSKSKKSAKDDEGTGDDESAEDKAAEVEAAAEESAEENEGGEAAENDEGDFLIEYEDPTDEDVIALITAMQEEELFETTADALSQTVALPYDVSILFSESEQENGPYYDPNTTQIVMPYWFVKLTYDQLTASEFYDSEDAILLATVELTLFVLFHEMGHAIIDAHDLPVLGKEEDAADFLATVLAVDLLEYGDIALSGADLFGSMADLDPDLAAFADEHALDIQRFYTIRCLVFGADPEAYSYAFDGVEIEQERLDRCPEEYSQASESWNSALEPHFL